MKTIISVLLIVLSNSAFADHGLDWCRESTLFAKGMGEMNERGGQQEFMHSAVDANQGGGLTRKYPTLSKEDMHAIVNWVYEKNLHAAEARKAWSDTCMKAYKDGTIK
jgi:hypothetical protein